MALREIRTYPDPILRNKTSRVERIDSTLDRLIEDMVETMHAAPGVGLAANQVGVPFQLTGRRRSASSAPRHHQSRTARYGGVGH
jgi:peptide deformylase